MNLIKTQQELNALPPTPESLQYLAGAAQGQLVNVPPWLALARMNEINRQIESAKNSAAQPPTETLSDSIPQNLEQNLGMAPQAGPPGQGGMPMAAGPQGGPPQGGMFPAQGAPQGADMAMAPQSAGPTQMMASGGIAGVPVNPDVFEYGSGGIVAFAEGGTRKAIWGEGEGQVDPTEYPPAYQFSDDVAKYQARREARAPQAPAVAPIPTGANGYVDPQENFFALQRQAQERLKAVPAAEPEAEAVVRANMEAAGDYGINKGPIGVEDLKAKKAIAEARKAEADLQQKNMNSAKQMAIWKAFIDAGEATRGQGGIGALMGGFGKSFGKSTEDILDKESTLRLGKIKQDELLNDAMEAVQGLRRAQLDKNVASEYKHKADLSKIAKDLHMSENTLMGHLVTAAGMVAGKDMTSDASMNNAATRAAAVKAGVGKITPAMNAAEAIAAKVTELRAADPTLTPTAARTKAEEWYKSLAAVPGIASRESLARDANFRKWALVFKPEYMTATPERQAEIEAEYKRTHPGTQAGIASVPPRPAAAPGRMQFDASGNKVTAP